MTREGALSPEDLIESRAEAIDLVGSLLLTGVGMIAFIAGSFGIRTDDGLQSVNRVSAVLAIAGAGLVVGAVGLHVRLVDRVTQRLNTVPMGAPARWWQRSRLASLLYRPALIRCAWSIIRDRR